MIAVRAYNYTKNIIYATKLILLKTVAAAEGNFCYYEFNKFY